MMRYIPNELKMVEAWLETGVYHNRVTTTIDVLAKYCRDELKLNQSEACEYIHKHLAIGYSGYKADDWSEKVGKSVGKIYKQHLPISNVCFVEITEGEMQRVRDLKNEKLERIAFTMLVLLKIKHKVKNNSDSNWIEDGNSVIFKLANVKRVSEKNKCLLMHELVTLGYMRQSIKPSSKNSALNRELFYVDYESPVLITITDLDNFILDYDKYVGSKVIECGHCGKRLIATNNRAKYCKECAKEVKNKQIRECKVRKNKQNCEFLVGA